MAQIVEAQFPYTYKDDDGSVITFKDGERFILLNKANEDWWKVQRTGVFTGKHICYVPASYMKELVISPRGPTQYANQYVNLDVYKKIMSKDFDGLAKLGNTTMVVSKQQDTSEEAANSTNEEDDYDEDEEEDDDNAFLGTSLDEIPDDIRKYSLDGSIEAPTSPLSFEISPRSDRMKSFTLPSGWKKCKDEGSGRSFYFNEDDKKTAWKPPRMSVSEGKGNTSPRRASSPQQPSPRTQRNINSDNRRASSPPCSRPAQSPPIQSAPKGWTTEIDPDTKETLYINSVTKHKWRSCIDKNGKNYFYNINGQESAWSLPVIQTNDTPKALRRKSFDETLDGLIRRRTINSRPTGDRNSKTQSVYIRPTSTSSDENGTNGRAKSPTPSPRPSPRPRPLPRAKSEQSFEVIEVPPPEPEPQDLSVVQPSLEGYLYRRKVVEGGKQVKKAVWQQVYCCQFGASLVFYKDQKSATAKPGFPTGKPESSLHLLGASLDHVSKDKAKGKKNVFQVSTYGGQHIFQFVAESQVDMGAWITSIQTTIKQLEEEEDVPSPPPMIDVPDGNGNTINQGTVSPPPPHLADHLSSLSPANAGAKPTTPSMPKKLLQPGGEKERGGFKGFKRTFSKKVLNSNDEEKDKTNTKDKLRKFFKRRPTFSDLEKNGIIKGLDTDGLYRVSGNLSSVNKLRVMVDHDEYVDLNQPEWSDIHLLTGAIKLYFRELPEPLIPFYSFETCIAAMKSPFKAEKIKKLKNCIDEMPSVNRSTLEFVIQHLVRVMAHSSQNRMHSQNLAIVFGPTLLWPEVESLNMAMTTVYQNQVIEFLLVECQNFFPEYV